MQQAERGSQAMDEPPAPNRAAHSGMLRKAALVIPPHPLDQRGRFAGARHITGNAA
jgi:hypothetical protein